MTYRNWKQELEDRRPTGRRRPTVWLLVAAAVVLAAALFFVLWGWPGWLRNGEDSQERPGAEDLYLSTVQSVLSSDTPRTGVRA